MKSNYFLPGTFVGLVCALLMDYGMMGQAFGEIFWIEWDQKYFGGISTLIGTLASLGLAVYLDRLKKPFRFWFHGLAAPALIFVTGMLAGCFINGLINGRELEFFDYGIKPLYWLS